MDEATPPAPFDTACLIAALGDTAALAERTGLSKPAISQWKARDNIPGPWLKLLKMQMNRKPEHKAAWAQYDAYLAGTTA